MFKTVCADKKMTIVVWGHAACGDEGCIYLPSGAKIFRKVKSFGKCFDSVLEISIDTFVGEWPCV